MQLSISTSHGREPWRHEKFVTADAMFLDDIPQLLLNHVWSPIVWKEGKRLTENFVSSDLLVFDFDDGTWTINDAEAWVEERAFRAVIGTTRSHLKEKGGRTVHRFRMILEWHGSITHYGTYRQNCERLFALVPCDRQCKDGARMYQPCKEIVLQKSEGSAVEWLPYKEPVARSVGREYYKKYGVLPRFIQTMMRENPSVGLRNQHCFRIAAKLAEMGFPEHDCIAAVMQCAVELPEKEKEITARSGFKTGRAILESTPKT